MNAVLTLQVALDLRNRREDLAAEVVSLIDGLLVGDVAIATVITLSLIIIQIALTVRGLR